MMCGSQSRSSNTRADLISRAASRTPARAVASRGEGRVARPRATDQQLVGVGQGVCGLPSRKDGMRCGAWCGARCQAGGTRACREKGDSRLEAQSMHGAHVEHVAHFREARRVPAQRLVEH